ncbi:MAG TPA: hypothetical protein VIN08_26660 [Ohtaekwangia sp.]|uniref:COG3014 family protein n=1 Tax=Ohtaekwangia sp. TaxID=2066019 RepID=UPI002F94C185
MSDQQKVKRVDSKKFARTSAYVFLISIVMLLVTACASYYQKNFDFNHEFERGDLQQALTSLEKNSKQEQGRARFLYMVNNGLLLSILGRYEESNEYFEKAFLFGEDYHINYLNEAASYFTNPSVTTYHGEDHEHLMVLYFKALNYLKLNQHEEALVECRRLSIRLNQLNDKYNAEEKYQRDAFVNTLMGIVYQSDQDYNNAFIAYRNAVEIYQNDYAKMFGMQVPEQLKYDLINTAYWTGFQDEATKYKEQFGMQDYEPVKPDAELVFFWHNGLGPVKNEWSINFVIDPVANNGVVFSNPELGLAFPFQLEEDDHKKQSDLKKLQVFRVAFPRYVERPAYYNTGSLELDGKTYALELGEDVNKVAFYSLKKRMMQEFSKGLLRAAMKKVAEQSVRKEDEALGAVLGLVNAMTEKADTRNWQTLPHSIYYTRVPLKEGANAVALTLKADEEHATTHNFTYQVKKGQTLFHTFSSLESTNAPYRYY